MATRWVSRKERGQGPGGGMQRGGKEGEGNRFELLRNLNSETEGDNNVAVSGEEGTGRRGGSQGRESESVEMTESDNGTGNGEVRGEANRKRTLETRSPGTHLDSRVSRLRMDEFELGEIFEEVNKYWREGSKDLIDKAPEGYRQELKSGMDLFLEGMKKIMDGVSDRVTLERRKREAGEMNMEDKLGKIEDKIKDIQRKNDNVMTDNIQDKVKASRLAHPQWERTRMEERQLVVGNKTDPSPNSLLTQYSIFLFYCT
jgi:hypothetical protein